MYIRSFLNCLSAHFHTYECMYECMSNTLSTGTPRFCWRILMWWTVWDDWPRCSCSISSCSYASAATILTSLMELSQVCARERKEGGREGEERILSEWLSVLLSVCVFISTPSRPSLHHRHSPGSKQRQDVCSGEASSSTAWGGFPCTHLLPDDTHAGHPGGLLSLERVPILQAGWTDCTHWQTGMHLCCSVDVP